jgi:hypothetical protein
MEELLGQQGAEGSGALLRGVEADEEAAEWGLDELRSDSTTVGDW